MPEKKVIGARLRALRKARNLSMEKLARKLDISFTSVNQYESGTVTPRDEVKVKLANFFGVTVQEIFFDV